MNRIKPILSFGGVLLVGTLTSALVALAGSVGFYPLDARRVNLKQGEIVFNTRCASCHQLSATSAPSYGPTLAGIGELAHKRIDGMSGEAYLLQSITQPDKFRAPGSSGTMPSNLVNQISREDVLNVVAFLSSQGAPVHYRKLLDLKLDWPAPAAAEMRKSRLESIEQGKALFLGKLQCSRCHAFDGNPESALKAPTLAMIGNQSREYLRQAILQPSQHISPAYIMCTVVREGKFVQGRRLGSDPEKVRLLIDHNDRLEAVTFKLAELDPLNDEGEIVQNSKVSFMPAYVNSITPEEIEPLIDFLATFR